VPASEFYDNVWSSLAELDAKSPAGFHRRRLLLELAREYAPFARTILEVGCGQGALLAELARAFRAADLSGIDASEAALVHARKRCSRAELSVFDLEQSDGHAFARRFDLIVCSEVLEHLEHDALALRRVCGWLRPGGHLLVSVPGGAPTRFDLAIGHLRHYDVPLLSARLEQAGLRVDRVFGWGFPFHNLYRELVRVASAFAFNEAAPARAPSPLLGAAYRALSLPLRSLYFLNQPFWGPQLFAIASYSGMAGAASAMASSSA